MADLCEEGEIADSQEEEEQGETSLKEDEKDGEWTYVAKGPPRKRQLSANTQNNNSNKKKKRKRTVTCYDTNDDTTDQPEPFTVDPGPSTTESLSQNQKGLLRYISDIVTSITTSTPYKGKLPITDFKTADFRTVLRHVLTGEPRVIGKKGQLVYVDLLRSAKVVMVWLACLSRDDYRERGSECLKGIKYLCNSEFSLVHPGSDRFAHFGLETFMEMEEKEDKASLLATPLLAEIFTKRNCLLSHQQLIENEFPLPSGLPPDSTLPSIACEDQTDLSLQTTTTDTCSNANIPDYIMLEEWPNDVSQCLNDTSIDDYPLYAIDCEMIKTEVGSELARVSIINEDLSCVYSTLVKPVNTIIDYLTRFSGVNEEMLSDVRVKLTDVHVKLKQLLPPKCILIGHSLENDLSALRLHHPYIIDTSLLFTPLATPRCKMSLKKIVKKLLNKDIQMSLGGHDPTEDALACMELVKKKLIEGPGCTVQWNQNKKWFPVHLASQGITTKIIDKQSLACLYTDRSERNGITVSSDSEAVSVVKREICNDNRFTFVQLHALENLRREERELTSEEISSTMTHLDKHTCEIIDACPKGKGTLVLVVCGSSHIKAVRELQRDPNTPNSVLKAAVKRAREAVVLVAYK